VVLYASAQQAQQTADADAQQNQPANTSATSAEHPDQKLSGLSVILKVSSLAGEPLFEADGYRIRIAPGAEITFAGSLKTLADVGPNTWIRFSGVRDDTGVLVARKAEFFPAGTRKGITAMGPTKVKPTPDYRPISQDSLLDSDGHFANPHTKVRMSDAGPCGWHRVPSNQPLQERVERIGMSIVPAYQKLLPADSPSRIPFRFYAVADDKIRSVFACSAGLVLVPKNVVERLQNDDQLAAVLANGVALQLQRQLVTLASLQMTAEGAEFAALALSPAGFIAGDAAVGIVGHELEVRLEREIARIALQLLSHAGYDPWQAPEAWRLLGPKEPPKDIRSLPYTREGKYQLGILKVQYRRGGSGVAVESSASPTEPH
jgi:hypothetical protein